MDDRFAGRTNLVPYPPPAALSGAVIRLATPFPNPTEPNEAASIMYFSTLLRLKSVQCCMGD